MSTLADRGIAALRLNHDDLAARVRSFDDADLGRMSGSREWTVAQVLSHLGSGAEIMRANLQAAVSGGEQPAQDFNQSVWGRWDALSPREQADSFLERNELLVSDFEGLDDRARADLRIPLGFLPAPADIATFAGLRLNEAALHSWDVRVAFDPDAAMASEEAAVALEQFTGPLGFFLGFMGKPESLEAADASLRVELTDPDRTVGLVLAPSTALTAEATGADDALSGPAEALIRLISGRLDTVRTPDALTLQSDTLTLDQVKAVFPGF